MTKQDVEEFAENIDEQIMCFSDYEDCILGISVDNRVIYSFQKMAEYVMRKDSCDFTDALDHIHSNTIRSLEQMDSDVRPIILDDL